MRPKDGATDLLWFTMPYVDGRDAPGAGCNRERQLPLEDALRIAREAAEALEHAHRAGVVHRDIKPENLMLTASGAGWHTLVADFGIARALAGAGVEHLTKTGLAVGTPAYMSPEQAAGDRGLDARSDVYSLAAVLYESLAGEPPYSGPTMQAMIARRFTESPRPLRALRATVPEAWTRRSGKRWRSRRRTGAAAPRVRPCPGGGRPPRTGADRFPVIGDRGTGDRGDPLSTSAAQPPPRRRYPLTAAMVLGFLIGLGVLFGWLRKHNADAASGDGERRLAVLPFENLGEPEDGYFADGVTDEIRGKLSALPGLQVTARSSSSQYKGTPKSPAEIGRELGVDYLLTGTVRWVKGGAGSRVRVSPELIQVSTGSSRWQEPFDAALTDVFQVQADVAGRVAEALNLALGAGERSASRRSPRRASPPMTPT